MKFQRKQIIVGLILFSIVYGIVLFFALKTKNTIPVLVGFMVVLMAILMIADIIERQIKGDPSKIKNDINFPYFVYLTFLVTLFTCLLLLTLNSISYKINGIEATATVYDIDKTIRYKTEYDDDGNSYEKKEETCEVYIQYDVDGKEYKTNLDVRDCNMNIGQKVKIYYNKDNPSEYASDSSPILAFATAIAGLGLGIYLFMTYKDLFSKKKKKNNDNG